MSFSPPIRPGSETPAERVQRLRVERRVDAVCLVCIGVTLVAFVCGMAWAALQ